MFARSLPKTAALLLLSAFPCGSALATDLATNSIKETQPTIYVVKDDGSTSAPVIDPGSGTVLGFLPRKTEIVTFGANAELVMISLDRRSAFVPKAGLEPKYPLPPERPEFVISPGGLEKNIARARETAKTRRAEGLAPRELQTPFGYVPEEEGTQGQGGQQGGGGGRSGGGGGGSGI
jgi:uncharacterized membrane protein YgcG